MNNLLYLFIIFFMIHEFEEIILMNCWMKKKTRVFNFKASNIIEIHNKKK
ncbi:HXXEE domain-containing protein [Bacteroides thetaiotaomicron]